MEQIIIHVDMDAFFAAVEIRDNPLLRGKPVIIGSLPHERGVVSTCSYEARRYGVRSAMNVKEAYRLCPNGVFMRPHFEKYRAVSEQLRKIWGTYATAMETVALDEAYLDIKEQAKDLEGARKIARTIKLRTQREVGLSCSVGVAYSKTAAKIASEEKKPNGYFEIPTPEDFVKLILDRDVCVLYTVGVKTAEKLGAQGIRTVRDIQEKQDVVKSVLGKQGHWITQLAFGVDERKVVTYRPQDAKTISREVTFQKDVEDYALLRDVLFLLAVCVERRAVKVGRHGKGVTLKVTYTNMESITRSRRINFCATAVDIYREAVRLLSGLEERTVRLIGVGIYDLGEGEGEDRQLCFGEVLGGKIEDDKAVRRGLFANLRRKYGLDFEGHVEEIYHGETLHKTVEYMRKYTAKEKTNTMK